jgi:hypothetical protein
MAFVGYTITEYNSEHDNSLFNTNTISAATIPSWNYNGQLPLDLQLDLAKRIKPDTIVIHDTVLVNNTKYIRVPVPKRTTDTLYINVAELQEIEVLPVKNRSPGDREERTLDETQSPKQSVILIIDGNQVYSSKTDISSEVSDEP